MPLYNELILVEPVGTAAMRAAKAMGNRKVIKTHQNVLIFYKGDPKEIKNEFPNISYEKKDLYQHIDEYLA